MYHDMYCQCGKQKTLDLDKGKYICEKCDKENKNRIQKLRKAVQASNEQRKVKKVWINTKQ